MSKGFDCKRMEGDAGKREERQVKRRGLWGTGNPEAML